MNKIIAILGSLSRTAAFAIGMFMLVVISMLDYLTGSEYSFSIFFLIPVIAVTWQAGRRAGFTTSILAAVAWLAAEKAGDRVYSSQVIPYWNAAVRFGFFIIVATLITRVKHSAQTEGALARTDSLTGIANSRHFFEVAQLEIDRCRRKQRPLSIVYLDIDGFKQINDSLGHSAGDELLHYAAQEISRQLRSTDTIARLGGDEFALLLVETPQDEARSVVARLRERLLRDVKKRGWPVGFSFGIATFLIMPETVDELLRQADTLMYRAKDSDREPIVSQVFD